MTHPSKRKGDKAELEVQGMIREELGLPARRALGAGRNDDKGDIDGIPDTVIQVANWADLDRAVRTKLPDLERQQANAGATHAALFCRRRGGTWVVVMTPEMWFALIRETLDDSKDDTEELALMGQPELPLSPPPGSKANRMGLR